MSRYLDFEIEAFEVGRGLWHARVRRVDGKSILIEDFSSETFHVGIAWQTREAAIADAKHYIDRMIGRLDAA
jgi:hypothetical protein